MKHFISPLIILLVVLSLILVIAGIQQAFINIGSFGGVHYASDGGTATFGNNADEGSDRDLYNTIWGYVAAPMKGSGYVNSIWIRLTTYNSPKQVTALLYKASDSSLVCSITKTATNNGQTWTEFDTGTTNVLVTQGTDYVICGWGQSGGTDIAASYVLNAGKEEALTYGTPPNPASFSSANWRISAYVNYTITSAPTTYNVAFGSTGLSHVPFLLDRDVKTQSYTNTTLSFVEYNTTHVVDFPANISSIGSWYTFQYWTDNPSYTYPVRSFDFTQNAVYTVKYAATTAPTYDTPSVQLSALRIDGNTLKDDYGTFFMNGLNFRGQAYPTNNDNWCPVFNASADARVADGINTFRINPYYVWLESSADRTKFTYNSTTFTQVRNVVKWGNARHLYIIVNPHTYDTATAMAPLAKFIDIHDDTLADTWYTGIDSTSGAEHLKNLWLKISSYLKNTNGVVYDILNEPMASGSLSNQQYSDYWQQIAEYVIWQLRLVGDNHLCLVENSPWPGDSEFCTKLFNGNYTQWNVAFSPHPYQGISPPNVNNAYSTPSFYTNLYNAAWGGSTPDGNINCMGSNLKTTLNAPFFIGEFGELETVTSGTTKDQYVSAFLNVASALAPNIIGWAYWAQYSSYSDGSPNDMGVIWAREASYSAGFQTTVHLTGS